MGEILTTKRLGGKGHLSAADRTAERAARDARRVEARRLAVEGERPEPGPATPPAPKARTRPRDL